MLTVFRRISAHRIATGALLCVPFTIIAFQPIRFDGYDPEKIGLIGLFVAVIVGLQLGAKLHPASRESALAWLRVPLRSTVMVFTLATIASTAVSLSPSLSFWGEPSRMQGLFALLLYVVLFLQASRLDRTERASLIPILLAAAIPVCFWQVVLYREGANRLLLGSSAGNPNFLSSWIVMTLLYCVPQLLSEIAAWRRPISRKHWLNIAFYALPIALMLASLLISASRGALAGLVAGTLFYIVGAGAVAGNRKLLGAIGIAALVGAISYIGISAWIQTNPTGITQARRDQIARLFMPYDAVRLQVWSAASQVLFLQGQPLFTINRQPDTLAQVRPLVGYGPETFEQLQSRFGDIFGPNVSVNSFHNAVYDMLMTQGWLGFVAWLLVLESALAIGLRHVNLLSFGRLWDWLGWQVLGAAGGVAILSLLVSGSSPSVLAPVGAALGAIAGLILWTGKRGFARPAAVGPTLSHVDTPVILAILAIIVAQWIDNQFGFAQGSTQPLFWIFLGLLAGTVTTTSPAPVEAPTIASPTCWYAAGLVAGLFSLHSFGKLLHSAFLQFETGSAQLPVLMVVVLALAVVGAWFQSRDGQLSLRGMLIASGVVVIAWSAFFLLKTLALSADGVWLDSAMTKSEISQVAHDLETPGLLLAGSGILASLISTIGISVLMLERDTMESALVPRLKAIKVIVVGGCLLMGGTLYATRYASGVLHNIGNSYVHQPALFLLQPPPVAIAALETASVLTPSNVPLRLDWASALASSLATPNNAKSESEVRAQITDLLTGIFQDQPFFVNTLEWRNFSSTYASLLKP